MFTLARPAREIDWAARPFLWEYRAIWAYETNMVDLRSLHLAAQVHMFVGPHFYPIPIQSNAVYEKLRTVDCEPVSMLVETKVVHLGQC